MCADEQAAVNQPELNSTVLLAARTVGGVLRVEDTASHVTSESVRCSDSRAVKGRSRRRRATVPYEDQRVKPRTFEVRTGPDNARQTYADIDMRQTGFTACRTPRVHLPTTLHDARESENDPMWDQSIRLNDLMYSQPSAAGGWREDDVWSNGVAAGSVPVGDDTGWQSGVSHVLALRYSSSM